MLQKKYEDYLSQMYELFPDIEEESIQSIIVYGLKKIYDLVKIGSDVLMKDQENSIFIGTSIKASLEQQIASKLKEHSKLRRLFLDKKQPWDGYHYFGLTEEENEEFKTTPKIVTLYKITKECSIRSKVKYVYKINLRYTIPVNKIVWREDRLVSLEEVELSKEETNRIKNKRMGVFNQNIVE